ncbi:hypothetical protein JHT19_06195 [Vibrio parahaemolyticus]|uniref:Uncharacterized protein n=1 Tax=Vibrio parahaemolyticus TaxID=670 RepID=A0A8H9K0U1_VIBPH|nr:hypothetical protein JHT19_06195 [Vibrio parahaemolyticus]HAS6672746.1 hypothetical protein [Vibrio parahaemolyticus]HAS6674865.1 hypothetical protein [Vibrio parahaemolyticus]HAS6678599.1 hypothetical protein [Vibrio parahaemolyticus]HAS6680565.1 hypothetical protein [Vibrio parahaemolyticus]
MAKLTKGEIQGIRLVADVFVFNDLVNNVFAKDEDLKGHADGLKQHVNKSCPKLELAQKELQTQIKAVREVWLNEITKK